MPSIEFGGVYKNYLTTFICVLMCWYMSGKTIETFYIPGTYQYNMSTEHNAPGFVPWSGGSAIHRPFPSKDECRQYIFDNAKADLQRKQAHFKRKLEEIETSLKTLGDDKFNLGEFKI